MRFLLLVLFTVFLAGCTEKPQRLEQTSEQAAKADGSQRERRQRTMGQSESERIYQQGTLR